MFKQLSLPELVLSVCCKAEAGIVLTECYTGTLKNNGVRGSFACRSGKLVKMAVNRDHPDIN